MQYENIVAGIFRKRPNRFVAEVEIQGQIVISHVKNTGRCQELLIPGAEVYLQDWGEAHEGRKTRYDLIAVRKGQRLINMDAQAPNKVFLEWARQQGGLWKPEVTWGNSRFDFAWQAGERKGFVEVKGVTLEEDGVVLFPDAPTERGVKHLRELKKAREEGFEAAVCFVVQMENVRCFRPNEKTHPEFGAALREAAESGVTVFARRCRVTPDGLTLAEEVPVELGEGKCL